MFKGWSNRDWVWLVCLLAFSIIVIISNWLAGFDDNNILNYISFMATGVSVALALVAIGISISQNESSKVLNTRMNSTIERMDEKLNSMKDSIINNMQPVKKEDNATNAKDENYGLSRLHGIISTRRQWDGKEYIYKLNNNLERKDSYIKLIDYSIMPLKKPVVEGFDYSTNINFLFNKKIDKLIIDDVIEGTLYDLGVNIFSIQTYFNNNI